MHLVCTLLKCPKRESLQKWLGEGAKVFLTLLGPGSKGLPRVFCTTQTLFCTAATPFRTSARGLLLAGSKRPFAPSPNHFRELSLFGQRLLPASLETQDPDSTPNSEEFEKPQPLLVSEKVLQYTSTLYSSTPPHLYRCTFLASKP